MDKHTFKVGDRVITTPGKNRGVFVRYDADRCHIHRDDGETSYGFETYWIYRQLLEHDRDFQAGDWVRYEGISRNTTHGKEGQIGQIINMWRDGFGNWATVKGISGRLAPESTPTNDVANLVKIQPPRKEKTVDIRRKEDGHVSRHVDEIGYNNVTHDVKEIDDRQYGWVRVGKYITTYYPRSEWEPVEEWVTIQVDKHDWDKADKGCGEFLTMSRTNNAVVRWRYPK